jgi:hypothetical protein
MEEIRKQRIIFFESDLSQFSKKSKRSVPVLIVVYEANIVGGEIGLPCNYF